MKRTQASAFGVEPSCHRLRCRTIGGKAAVCGQGKGCALLVELGATLVGIIAASWWLYSGLSRLTLTRKEQRILQRKYGDLPMFEGFFRRLEAERRERRRWPR